MDATSEMLMTEAHQVHGLSTGADPVAHFFDFFQSYDPLFTFSFLVSLLVALLILLTQRWHLGLTEDDAAGVQKFHTRRTPRIGGVAVFFALVLTSLWGLHWVPESSEQALQEGHLLQSLALASVPAFAFGLAEDLTGRVGILLRLLATIFSGVLAWVMTGDLLRNVDTWVVDGLLQFTPLAVLFTVVAVAGVANSLNMVDGFNGLASGMSSLAFLCFAVIAWRVDEPSVVLVCLVSAGATLGFLMLNWPWGRLFLGDGGAYLLGFLLAWVAITLKVRHEQISAYALWMVLMYPLVDMFFAIIRRLARGRHPGMPDRLHFHSLLKARYVRRWLSGFGHTWRNSSVGLLVVLMGLAGQLLALLTLFSVPGSLLAWAVLLCAYLMLYGRMATRRWLSPVTVLVGRRRRSS